MKMKLLEPVLGENLEDIHCELECQRSAEQATQVRSSSY